MEDDPIARTVGKIWETDANLALRPYFNFYQERCQYFLVEGGGYILVKEQEDIVHYCQKVLGNSDRDILRSDLTRRFPTADADVIDTTLDLCASLVSMVEIGKHTFRRPGCNPVQWKTGSLKDCISSRFTVQRTLSSGTLKLGKGFTARNLGRFSGIEVKWTTNPADHLLLTDDDRTVLVFHCVSFLKMHQVVDGELFPTALISETLQTLALLFPQNDSQTRKWLRSHTRSSATTHIDPEIGRCGNLRTSDRRFEAFAFWHDRLVVLKQAFDESRPWKLSQWWYDRRDGNRWYTFWIAVMVFIAAVIFGVIQCVEGALQVYISLKALQQGEKQKTVGNGTSSK